MAGVVVIVVVRIVHIVRIFSVINVIIVQIHLYIMVAIGREEAMLMGIDNDVILIVEIVSKRDTTREELKYHVTKSHRYPIDSNVLYNDVGLWR